MTKTKFEKIKIINDLLTWITRVASVSGRFAWSCAFVPLSIVAVNPLAPLVALLRLHRQRGDRAGF
jgi:hypothetical protein